LQGLGGALLFPRTRDTEKKPARSLDPGVIRDPGGGLLQNCKAFLAEFGVVRGNLRISQRKVSQVRLCFA
jgi:hypothetical protein